MTQWIAVALGGALGSLIRFALVNITPTLGVARFPLGTLLVNIVGSFLIGIAYVILVQHQLLSTPWRHFFIAGILGGFTTFSSFSLDLLQLTQQGFLLQAILYAGLSLSVGLLAAYAGCVVAQRFI